MVKSKKILVQYINLDSSTKWKKYKIDSNQKVLIKSGKGGPGGMKLEPSITVKNIFTKGWFRTPYVIYAHGSKTFLIRGESDLPSFSMATVEEYFQNRVLSWIRSSMTKEEPIYNIIVIGLLLLIALMCAVGFGFVNIG